MSLHGDISINGHRIAVWDAQRIDGGTEPDNINTYKWRYLYPSKPIQSGEVTHRYGDGAEKLLLKIMEAVTREEETDGDVS